MRGVAYDDGHVTVLRTSFASATVPNPGQVVGAAEDSFTHSQSSCQLEVVARRPHRRSEEVQQAPVLDVHPQRFLDHDDIAAIASTAHTRPVDTHSCNRRRLGHS